MLCKKCFYNLTIEERVCFNSGKTWWHCHHDEQEKEIIACKLTNPTKQCIDYDLKIERGWCKDCLNHIIVIYGMKLDE